MADSIFADPTFWVAGSIVTFGVLAGKKIVGAVGSMLDERGQKIANQIEEAKQLREEAETLLADLQKKQREAESTAAAMIAQAEEDAKILRAEAEKDIEALVRRRERVAGEKIAQMEAAAIKEVRAAAVDVAVDAATKVLSDTMKGDAGAKLAEASIKDVGAKLH